MIASSPPLFIIGTEPFIPQMGWSAVAAPMLATLPPVFCISICFTASWVMSK